MIQFDYETTLSKLMVPEIVSALGDIRELKGKATSFSKTSPKTLATLIEVAKIQSTGASNRIEIMDANPGMSQRTLERILAKLQNEGAIEKVGAARATAYRATG